jgi:hypothetical protein
MFEEIDECRFLIFDEEEEIGGYLLSAILYGALGTIRAMGSVASNRWLMVRSKV